MRSFTTLATLSSVSLMFFRAEQYLGKDTGAFVFIHCLHISNVWNRRQAAFFLSEEGPSHFNKVSDKLRGQDQNRESYPPRSNFVLFSSFKPYGNKII